MEYSKHYLTQVIFQVNFNIEALKDTLHPELIELCKEKTSANLNEAKHTNIEVLPDKVSSKVSSKWVFKGEVFQIVLQRDFLQIINLKYTNHNDYHPIIETVFNKVKEIYKPIFTRVALRYINHIRFPEGNTYDFNGIINESLLSPTLDYRDFGLNRSLGIMNIFNEEQGINTNFTYGFFNSEFPNRIAKREFLLDYDCFMMLNTPIESVEPIILTLRNNVNTLFEKSVLEGLKTTMR